MLEEVSARSRNGWHSQGNQQTWVRAEDAIVTRQGCPQGHHNELAGHREWGPAEEEEHPQGSGASGWEEKNLVKENEHGEASG